MNLAHGDLIAAKVSVDFDDSNRPYTDEEFEVRRAEMFPELDGRWRKKGACS